MRKAGEGQLQIMVNNGNIPNKVESREMGVYAIHFIPIETGPQKVDILFNEEPLPGKTEATLFFSLWCSCSFFTNCSTRKGMHVWSICSHVKYIFPFSPKFCLK